MGRTPTPDGLTPAQEALVLNHMAEAERIGRAIWRQNGGDRDEHVALALLGLVQAAAAYTYDPNVTPFIVYAKPRIRGAIQDHFRSVDHVSRSVRTKYRRGQASPAEVAEVEGRPLSYDAPGTASAGAAAVFQLGRPTRVEDQASESLIPRAVAAFVDELPPVHRTVMALHYFVGLELAQIASMLIEVTDDNGQVTEAPLPVSRVGSIHIQAVLQVVERLREFLAE